VSGSKSSANRSSPSSTSAPAATLAAQLESELERHRNPVRAASEKAYLKSDLEFIGVPLPAMRQMVRALKQQHSALDRTRLMQLVENLWSPRVFEKRMLVVLLLEAFQARLRPADIRLLERLIRESKTWAFVDELAVAITGPLLQRSPQLARTLDRWARDDDFWLRRAAILALLLPLRRGGGDFPRFARYADAMLAEREFFIRKAIGWVLRETGKRQPDLVYKWLLPRCGLASGVTVREAVKYLSPAQRAALLAAYQGQKRPRLASGRALR
jgi:3-methyladenine DNA glycosylase AlkD